jgi:hypothetical protein
MRHRSHIPVEERKARSKMTKISQDRPLLCGSLVTMSRVCGKSNCRCVDGEKHVSLYLQIREGEKRKMIHVPRHLEGIVREWVEDYQMMKELMEQVSQSCLDQFLKEKARRSRSTKKP